jgi:hypothetical protein
MANVFADWQKRQAREPETRHAQCDLVVATENVAFDDEHGHPVMIHAGGVLPAGSPLLRGREQFFEPLTIVLFGEPDVPLSLATIRVIGDNPAESGYRQFVRIGVRTSHAELIG